MEPENELLRGYEDTMYRYDRVDHIAGRLGQLPARVLRTRRLVLDLLDELCRPFLRRTGFEQVAYMGLFDHDYALVSALIER
ncbi:hypothetical protein PIB30_071350 [Stylosanthes scabra]|uniref:Uncharacterized protein n=1 Tax=Stylosanthes scabra TaxID=79078 RepID=A0ABU6WRV5_9FABA|nr:hypothetical protein [Stylosanthes scabra]